MHIDFIIIIICYYYYYYSVALGVRNEFFNQLHKFLAHLTDAQHKTAGHTVLYVPDEGSLMSDPNSYKNKEFVQRMESKE